LSCMNCARSQEEERREQVAKQRALDSIGLMNCGICASKLDDPVRLTMCGTDESPHVFCRGCIMRWTRTERRFEEGGAAMRGTSGCPLCRTEFTTKVRSKAFLLPGTVCACLARAHTHTHTHTRTPPCTSAAQDFVSVDVRVAYEPPAKRVCVKCKKESDGSAHLQTTMPCCRACVCEPCVTNAEFHVGVIDPSENIAFPMECPGCSGTVCRDNVLDLGVFV